MSTSDQNGVARWSIPSAATVLNVAWLAIVLGLLFGSMTLTLTYYAVSAPASSAALLLLAINEIIHPVGCSLVLMSAEALGQRASALNPNQCNY
jgi:uncharacterized membrane protein